MSVDKTNTGLVVLVLMLLLACTRTALGAQHLVAVYEQVRARDPQLAAARSQLAIAEEKRVQARAALLPQVALNLSTNRQNGEAAFNGAAYADRAAHTSSAALALNQPLWRPGLWASRAQAELQIRQAEQFLRQAESELMLRTSQSYFDALVAQENVLVARSQREAVAQQLALARENFQAGLTTVADVHEAQARLSLAQAQVAAADTERAARQADLHRLVGGPPPVLARLTRSASPPGLEPAALEAWTAAAEADNPQLLAQQLGVAIAAQEVTRHAQAHGPSLDMTLGYGRNAATGSMTSPTELASRSRAAQWGMQLVIPIYAGGATQSRVREALALQDKAQSELEAARGQVLAQVRQAYAGVVNGLLQTESLAVAATASQAAVNANRIGYRLGTRINIDVLNAQQQQFNAERDLHKARTETIVQPLRLKAAAGRLQEADLQAVSALLESEP